MISNFYPVKKPHKNFRVEQLEALPSIWRGFLLPCLKNTFMDIEIRHTEAQEGSIEHYKHYVNEYHRLQEMVITTPIKYRHELEHNIDGLKITLDSYEDLSY